jgi:CheY-like chemotaxis protein
MTTKKQSQILIVDDEPIVLIALSHELLRAGYQITTADSGKKALALLEKSPSRFSAIILDRMMSPLSGLDVLHEIYKKPALKDIPVIMLTAHAEVTDKIAATIAGVFDILMKPAGEMDWEPLLMALKRAIREREKC